MSILRQAVSDDGIEHDVCIVGAGPVGIALALECERHGLSVLMLEAGGKRASWFHRAEMAEISHPRHHVPIHVATRSAFGGTSWAWSGLCVRFDDVDFQVREFVPHSGWPLAHSEVAPFYDKAATLLNCPPDAMPATNGSSNGLEWISTDCLAWPSSQPVLATSYWEHFRRSQAITLCLNSPVVGLGLSSDGERVETVRVAARGGAQNIRARRIVLAAGGLRTTQLLLTTQRRWPRHFGGQSGALGRFYMGHLTGWISSIRLNTRLDARQLLYGPTQEGKVGRRRLTIRSEKLLAERLLNIGFWPVAPLFYDPNRPHGSLSANIALAAPQLGQWMAGGFRHAFLGPPPRRTAEHLRHILKSPGKTATGVLGALSGKAAKRLDIAQSANGERPAIYSLQYHAEAEPKSENRVALADETDRLGLPRVKVDLQFGDRDAQSVVRAHAVLDQALRNAGRGQLIYWASQEQRARSVLDQATDGYHQMGTTRMGGDPAQSVVDKNCRVHGLANLFIASSSVFPTGGQANPTLLATALGLRLAEHLAANRARPSMARQTAPEAEVLPSKPISL
jgi:hypothetical protein